MRQVAFGGYPNLDVRVCRIGVRPRVGEACAHGCHRHARARLIRLRAERFQALELGIENPSPYLTRLEAAIEDARVDTRHERVREIAALRRALAGAAHG